MSKGGISPDVTTGPANRSSTEPVLFRNRYTGRIETEDIYGEAWLRWAYGTRLGRFALLAAARPWFSRWYGWRMDRPGSRRRIQPFIRKYGVNAAEFAGDAADFRSFNEFFMRALKPCARPINTDPKAAIFPADGRHLGVTDVTTATRVYVKGQQFDLSALLGDRKLAARYAGGSLVLSRLCPVDYHRFHFPVAGRPGRPRLIPGGLWSVNPIALRRRLTYLWENRRWLTEVVSEGAFGTVLMLEVGATNVGSAEFTFEPGRPVEKGREKGYFLFGGSLVMTLFEPGTIALSKDLLEAAAEGLELYARMGDTMGHAR